MAQWYERVGITEGIRLVDEEDAIIWQYESSGKYSVQSLYVVLNNRSVK
jgi:hypothetical protein